MSAVLFDANVNRRDERSESQNDKTTSDSNPNATIVPPLEPPPDPPK